MSGKCSRIGLMTAMLWFGMHCGPGLSSGSLTKLYVTEFGVRGLIVPLIAWTLCAVFMAVGLEYGRLIRAKSYRDVAGTMYGSHQRANRINILIWDIIQFLSLIFSLSSCIAGFGAQLEQDFGLPYWIGCAFFIPIIILLLCYGKRILALLGHISLIVCLFFFTVCIVAMINGFPHLIEVFRTPAGNAIKDASPSNMLFMGLAYSLIQLGAYPTLVISAGDFRSGKDTVTCIIAGFLINCIALTLSDLALLAHYPDVLDYKLPLLGTLQQMQGAFAGGLLIAYNLIIIIAYLSSSGGMMFGAIERYIPLLRKKISSERICRLIIIAGFLASSLAITPLGLDAILTSANMFVGFLRLPFWYLPMLILGPGLLWKIRRKRKETDIAPYHDSVHSV